MKAKTWTLSIFSLAAFLVNAQATCAQSAGAAAGAASAAKAAPAPANPLAQKTYQSIVSMYQKRPLRPVGIANDISSWTSVSIKFPIWKRIQGYLEVQPRFQMNHQNHYSETIMRTGIGYEFNKKWSIFNGYYYSAHNDPYYSPENRIWHQLTYTKQLGKITLQNRFRIEESWREAFVGPTVRVRNQIRLTRPISHSKFYAIVSDEPMYNLNTKSTGPVAGFTQNRFFIGFGRKLNTYTRLEIGYLNQYRNSRSAKPDPMNHVLAAQIAFDLTQGKAQRKESDYKLAKIDLRKAPELLACTPQLYLPGNNAPAEILATEHHLYTLIPVKQDTSQKLAQRKTVLM